MISRGFIRTISDGISRRSYKPGQTIVIQKAIDSGGHTGGSSVHRMAEIKVQDQRFNSTVHFFGECVAVQTSCAVA